MANSTKNTKTVTSETSSVIVAGVEKRTSAQIFADSLLKVKSTGNGIVDNAARKIIEKINNKELIMTAKGEGYEGTFNKVAIKVCKTKLGKSNRNVFSIGDLEIGGAFAAKAMRQSISQNKIKTLVTKEFDKAKVARLASLFEL